MPPGYLAPGLILAQNSNNDAMVVRELQRDLRALGYLYSGIDGNFGDQTTRAIRALQLDLLLNSGTGSDGSAPVAIKTFNQGNDGQPLVTAASGILDQGLARCMAALIASSQVQKLPAATDPQEQNSSALAAIAQKASTVAPTPFVIAIVVQESGGQHYHEPPPRDDDTFVTIGLDRNSQNDPDQITSRGYGIGQYTLFHHPPRSEEMADFIVDPVRNVQQTYSLLRDKFNGSVVGPASQASDRQVEHPLLPLQLCKYQPSDPLYMRDCKACAGKARKINIIRGTPAYQGATISYQPDQYYPSATYYNVPDRADFLCDWPYAARRYNGSGNDSFHYQTHILLNLMK